MSNGIAARARARQVVCTAALTMGIAVVSLGVAVPAALGEGRLAGSLQGGGPTPGYVAEAGSLAASSVTDRRTDAFDRGEVVPQVALYLDANERGRGPAPVAAALAGSEQGVAWQQLGIGFALGLALALGLVLVYRSTRQRTLAH